MGQAALKGLRIIDFSWAWAGPYATQLFALMGAEVIRVESRKRPDLTRWSRGSSRPSFQGTFQGSSFHDVNLNKRSVSLDLSQSGGVELAKKLVRVSDIVVENFRPGVMDRFGLGYSALKELQPSLIMLSLSTCGATGPHHHYIGYASTFAALSGLSYATGYADGVPTEFRGSIDLSTGTTIAFALLPAYYHRLKTGEGQHIDLSAWEGTSCLVGDIFMEYIMNGRVRPRMGNHDEVMAPHNCYPCRGEGKWVTIAVSAEEEWRALCQAMGNPPWTEEERFSDPLSRWRNQEELDRLVGQWTINRTDYEIMEMLQKAGVAAIPSFDSQELYDDPHLKERGYYVDVETPEDGKRTVAGAPWELSATPATIRQLGPSLGEHNEYVFGELLGIPASKIAKLVEERVLY